ncbi:MAG: DUF2254 domain-containing protein [Myxococcales bacterium]|nr:DUF2254 domain-containing protein [Myxococcales bacterium]
MLIQSDTVVSAVAHELRVAIDELFPESLGDDEPHAPVDIAAALPPDFITEAGAVRARKEGYIRTLDLASLMAVAEAERLVLDVRRRPGDFVIEGDVLIQAWPALRVEEKTEVRLLRAFVMGSLRTTEQDAAFAVDQLVEVALRALSPGINDPFTAIACIDRLRGGLARLVERRLPSPLRRDGAGMVRMVARPRTLGGLLGQAFHPIRPSAAAQAMVVVRMLDTLEALAERARRADDRAAIAAHVDLLVEDASAALTSGHDREWVTARAERVRAVLAGDAAPDWSGA